MNGRGKNRCRMKDDDVMECGRWRGIDSKGIKAQDRARAGHDRAWLGEAMPGTLLPTCYLLSYFWLA